MRIHKTLSMVIAVALTMPLCAGIFGTTSSDVREALLAKGRIGHSCYNPRIYRIEIDGIKVRRDYSEKDTWLIEYVTNLEREGRIRWSAKVQGGSVNGRFGGMAKEEVGVRVDSLGNVVDASPILWDSNPPVPDRIRKSQTELADSWKSVCGYYFGKNYINGKLDEDGDLVSEIEMALNPSYRYMTRIVLKHDNFDVWVRHAKGGYSKRDAGYGMYEVKLEGSLPANWKKERMEEECRVVADEMEKRFGVELLKIADCHYLYRAPQKSHAIIVMLSPTFEENCKIGIVRTMVVIVENREILPPSPKVFTPAVRRIGGSEVL